MPTTEPLPDDAGLHLLADHLCAALESGEVEPSLVRVVLEPEGFDLGLLPLSGDHPESILLGLDAAAEWHAIGVVVNGWAYRMDDRGHPDRDKVRVSVVTLVSRTGETAHQVSGLPTDDQPDTPTGEQIDLLRCSLGLPTDAPPAASSVFWAIEWLVALTSGPPVATVADAVSRHPAIRLLDGIQHDAPDVLETIGAFHRVCTWSRMRFLAAGDLFPSVGLDPSHAEWLDDGAFARRLLSRCPPLEQLRRTTRATLSTEISAAVFAMLDDLDVPFASWPDLPRATTCP